MIRYALFALPGPGDFVIRMTSEAACPPSLVVVSSPQDFDSLSIPRVDGTDQRLPDLLREAGIEAVIVTGWEKRIEPSIYSWCARGAWNVHPSLLPLYRGHNPYFYAIRDGVSETGVTVHALTPELDAGPILLQKRYAIKTNETLGSLWASLGALAGTAVIETLSLLERGDVSLTPQPSGLFPPAPKVQPNDLVIRPTHSIEEALRLTRAANPFYGVFVTQAGRTIKILEAAVTDSFCDTRGPVISLCDGAIVATVIEIEGVGIVSGARSRDFGY